jgi:response regulator NasT
MRCNLRIVVADDEKTMREYLANLLTTLGHQVVAAVRTGWELVATAASRQPDLVITDVKMPELDGLQAAERLNAMRPIPVIVISGYHQADLLDRAEIAPVLAYLVKPVTLDDLRPAIALTMRRFEQFQQLCQENGELRRDLEQRKLLERAKGALMKRLGVDEQHAYANLHKRANDCNRKVVDVAQEILAAEKIFEAFA